MAHTLRPLGSRILVTPDAIATETASGFVIPETYRNMPAMSGIVQALGTGPDSHRRIRSVSIARCIAIVEELAEQFPEATDYANAVRDGLGRYFAQMTELDHICAVGDRVVFPMEAGHQIVVGEDTEGAVLVLSEDAVLLVCEPAVEVAA